jgi:hypothetical protein
MKVGEAADGDGDGAAGAPPALRHALATIDQHVQDYITRARLKTAA